MAIMSPEERLDNIKQEIKEQEVLLHSIIDKKDKVISLEAEHRRTLNTLLVKINSKRNELEEIENKIKITQYSLERVNNSYILLSESREKTLNILKKKIDELEEKHRVYESKKLIDIDWQNLKYKKEIDKRNKELWTLRDEIIKLREEKVELLKEKKEFNERKTKEQDRLNNLSKELDKRNKRLDAYSKLLHNKA